MHRSALAVFIALSPVAASAQTEGARAITRDVFSQRPVPGAPARAIVESPPRTIVEERTVVERPARR